MALYNELEISVTYSEYLLGLSGDADYTASLAANRAKLVEYVQENADDYNSLVDILNGVYSVLSGKDATRAVLQAAFIEEATALGFENVEMLMSMSDAISAVRESGDPTLHSRLIETVGTLTGVYRAMAIAYYRILLNLCLAHRLYMTQMAFFKSLTVAMQAYIQAGIDDYAAGIPAFFYE